MEKILITGGAGFIGLNLIKYLHKKKNKIYVIDLPKKIKKYKKKLNGCVLISGNIENENLFNKINKKVDTVYHLAAKCSTEASEKMPINCLKTNVLGTTNLFNWSIKNRPKKIVFTSSMAVYGKVASNAKENYNCKPISIYGISKLAGEMIVSKLESNLTKVIILRLFNVYGPGQDMKNIKQGMLSIYLSQILKHKKVFIKGSLNRFRDFVFIDDVISALTHGFKKSNTYNVGFGKPYKVIDVIKILFNLTKNNFNKKKIKFLIKHSGDPWGNFANISKFKRIGWHPKFDLKFGAKETLKSVIKKKL
jgi:UDP-glucose 4-epimerase